MWLTCNNHVEYIYVNHHNCRHEYDLEDDVDMYDHHPRDYQGMLDFKITPTYWHIFRLACIDTLSN